MKKNIILIFLLFCSLSIFSQTDSTKIAFVAYWAVGDSYDFKVSKVKRQWKDDILTKKDSSQYIANFKVLDSTDVSYKIQWTYKSDIVSTFQEKAKKLFTDKDRVDEIMKKNDLSKIIYQTNEFGEFIEIINWEQLSETTELLFQEIVKGFEKTNPEKINEIKKAIQPIIDIYSSKQGIEQLAIYELQYFHFPFGSEFDITKPLVYDQEFPNILGGKPILAQATISFQDVNFDEYFCTIKEEVLLDSKDTKRVVKKLFSKMDINNSDTKKAIKNAVLDITDLNYYQYYYNPGVPHYIYGSRKFILKMEKTDIEKIDELYIELIYKD